MKKLENALERVSVKCTDVDLIVEVEFSRCSPADITCQQATYPFRLITPLTIKGQSPDEYEVLTPDNSNISSITFIVKEVIDGIRSSLIREFRSRITSLPFESACSETNVLKDYIEWRRPDIMSLIATRVAEEYQLRVGLTAVCREVRVYALDKDKFAYYDVSIKPEEKVNA